MSRHEFDVIVVGMGPGGEELAGRLAEAGHSVLGIDSHLVGGECPYYGCIPSKMIVRAADVLQEAHRAGLLAGLTAVVPNYTLVADRIRNEATDDWNDQVAVDRYTGKGGTFVRGKGRLDGANSVIVGDERYTARRGVVLATGTSPAIPPVPGLADAAPWTNRDIVKVQVLPDSLIVLGGGAIGLELGQAFNRFGCAVTIVEAGARILAPEEPETSELLTKVLRDEGVEVRTGAGATSVSRAFGTTGAVTVTLADGSELVADEILVAAGRVPNVRGIGLDTVGLDETARPAFTVDDRMRVDGLDGLWAIGDIAGKGAFTHMAIYEAGVAFDDITGAGSPRVAEEHALSRVTFTDPEVGSVGMTEAQARAAGLDVRIGFVQGLTSTRGWLHGPGNEGLMKVVADASTGVLVGASCVGPRGGEVLSMFNLAVHARIPVATLRTMIYAYPTFYRGALDALAALET